MRGREAGAHGCCVMAGLGMGDSLGPFLYPEGPPSTFREEMDGPMLS